MSSTVTAWVGSIPELVEELAVAVQFRLGRQIGGEDVVRDGRPDAEPVEHLPGMIGIAVGVDELRHGSRPSGDQAAPFEAVERDVVDVAHEMMRIDIVILHRSGERGAGTVKVHFLESAGLDRIDVEQPLDVGHHPLVD